MSLNHKYLLITGQDEKQQCKQWVAKLLCGSSSRWVAFWKKYLPTGRRNVRLRKQYLSFVETAPAVAFIFITRRTLSHCELSAAAQGRIFLIPSLFLTHAHMHRAPQCHYNNSLTLHFILILICSHTPNLFNPQVPKLQITGSQIRFNMQVPFNDLDMCSVISAASDETHCSKVNIFRKVFYYYFNKNLHPTVNEDKMYIHCYIYCDKYYWLSTIMAYIRICHTSQTLKYLVLHICLCMVHSLNIACTTRCYEGYWKEKNNKKDLRKKEGRGD